MEKFDIEHFPTSPSAIQMLNSVTKNGWYDRSYVGKWLYQVMGLTMDEVTEYIQSMYQEAFPETCTWTIPYWEVKHGIPMRSYLPLEERRKLVIEKRDIAKPLSPWRMEQILENILPCKVHVIDINEDETLPHPNVFRVELDDAEEDIDVGAAIQKLKEIKQSHTMFILCDTIRAGIEIHTNITSYKTFSPLTGTLPNQNILLDLKRKRLELHVESKEHEAEFPRTNEARAGEAPNTSTSLDLERKRLELHLDSKEHKAEFLRTDESKAGKNPEESTALDKSLSDIELHTSVKDYSGEIPLPGGKQSGAIPKQSTGLHGTPGGLSLDVSSVNYYVQTQLCGDDEL